MESIALVTGASRGIGRAIALELGQEGRCVCVNYYQHAEAAQEVVRQLQARGCRAMAVQADVADRTAVEHMIHTITDTWGPVDLLVNNAGISLQGLFQDTTDEQWDRILGVNLTGPRNTIQAVLPAMMLSQAGLHCQHLFHLGAAGRQLRGGVCLHQGGNCGNDPLPGAGAGPLRDPGQRRRPGLH